MPKSTRAVVTRISERGQLILPKVLRERRGWTAGTEFQIEERPDGVFLRPTVAEAPATMDETFGRLRTPKEIISDEDMQEAMLEEGRRLWSEEEGSDR